MALTRSFKETVKERAQRDPDFRVGLLREAVEALLRDELDDGKVLLRDYINATVGFDRSGRSNAQESEEFDANAERRGKSARRQSVLGDRTSAEARGY